MDLHTFQRRRRRVIISTSKDGIEQAKADWQADRFARVTGDDGERVPLPAR
jgi:hypothetical protein